MKLIQLVLLMVVVLLLSVTATLYFYSNYIIVDEWAIPAEAIVDGRTGFQHDKGKLLFGNVMGGNTGRKFVNVSNRKDETLQVKVGMDGDLGVWTEIEPREFTLDPGEHQKVALRLSIPEDPTYGNYSGTVRIVFKRPLI